MAKVAAGALVAPDGHDFTRDTVRVRHPVTRRNLSDDTYVRVAGHLAAIVTADNYRFAVEARANEYPRGV
jgi:hypothetical protein